MHAQAEASFSWFVSVINYKWNKRDVPNYRFLIPILKGSNTLNNTGVWSLIELASLYTVPLSAVNGLSRLTTTSNGQTWPIQKFSNRPITVESNRIGKADSNRILKLRRSLHWSACDRLNNFNATSTYTRQLCYSDERQGARELLTAQCTVKLTKIFVQSRPLLHP